MNQIINNVKYNLAVPKANAFQFAGITFTPFHRFLGGAARFEVISKRLYGRVLETPRWDYDKFYAKCSEQNANLTVDVFLMRVGNNPPILVVPAKNCLFGYQVN